MVVKFTLLIIEMEGCAVPSAMDLDELMVRNYISRMLSDNYTMLIIFAIVIALLIMVLSYFIKNTMRTLKDYKSNLQRSEAPKDKDSEVYVDDDNDNAVVDPKAYQESNKLNFMKQMDNAYQDYNLEKTSYIRATYNRTNDDVVDNRVVYKKYDDYVYEKKKST